MARELAIVVGVRAQDEHQSAIALEQVSQRLGTSGYALRRGVNFEAMATQRADHMSCVDALARHLGKASAVLVRQA